MIVDQRRCMSTASQRPEHHPSWAIVLTGSPSTRTIVTFGHGHPSPSSTPVIFANIGAVHGKLGSHHRSKDLACYSSVPIHLWKSGWIVSLARSNSPFTPGMKGCWNRLSNDPACGYPSSSKCQTKVPNLICQTLHTRHIRCDKPADSLGKFLGLIPWFRLGRDLVLGDVSPNLNGEPSTVETTSLSGLINRPFSTFLSPPTQSIQRCDTSPRLWGEEPSSNGMGGGRYD